jgi:hypothetical protein
MDNIAVIAVCLVIGLIMVYLIVGKLYSSNGTREGYYGLTPDVVRREPVLTQPIANIPNTYPDLIMKYDYSKIVDPFVEPSRRVARQDIQPVILKQMIDIPTRGDPDNYSQFGILVKECGDDPCDNKILRLFGRQQYPGSVTYEYYTMISSGNDQIKIPIKRCYRNELYNDDHVRIDELNAVYRVKLHKYDAPRYYPDVL